VRPDPGLVLVRILAVGLLRPLAEEVVFRLGVFGALRVRAGFLPAALLSAAAFGLLHWPQPDMIAAGTLAGLVLAWSYERTGTLVAPLGVHVLGNLVAL
jgi:membrane protease YdiL (CAAX protease family)